MLEQSQFLPEKQQIIFQNVFQQTPNPRVCFLFFLPRLKKLSFIRNTFASVFQLGVSGANSLWHGLLFLPFLSLFLFFFTSNDYFMHYINLLSVTQFFHLEMQWLTYHILYIINAGNFIIAMNLTECPTKNEFRRAGRDGQIRTEKMQFIKMKKDWGKLIQVQCLTPVWKVYLPSPC